MSQNQFNFMGWIKGKKLSEEHKQKINPLGRKHTLETIEKIRKSNFGKKRTPEQIERIRKSQYGFRIKDRSLLKRQDRHDCPIYKQWRKDIWLRDNFICQKCKKSGGKINAHHINNFADFPELRMVLDNGITFCNKCHISFHKIYGKKNNTREQLLEFLINKP